MTQSEIKNSIIGAMDEPKAPQEVVDKGLAIARTFTVRMKEKESVHAEENKKDLTNEIPHVEAPSMGGLRM